MCLARYLAASINVRSQLETNKGITLTGSYRCMDDLIHLESCRPAEYASLGQSFRLGNRENIWIKDFVIGILTIDVSIGLQGGI